MNRKKIHKISVLGCGWLGLPLANKLIEAGYQVKGSTTSKDKLGLLATTGIDPFLVQLNPEIEGDEIRCFLETDLLIINVPPGRPKEKADLYEAKMKHLAEAIRRSTIHKLLFVSSTSVYPEDNLTVDEFTETYAHSDSALRMLQAENIFNSLPNLQTTIIRMAGLIGPERHPGRFFAGKENMPNGLAPVNLIHLDDCIGMIKHIIQNGIWGETFNGAAPTHPAKMDFYDLASLKLNHKNANFVVEKNSYKVVNSEKIMNYGYEFKHPDLMGWLLQT